MRKNLTLISLMLGVMLLTSLGIVSALNESVSSSSSFGEGGTCIGCNVSILTPEAEEFYNGDEILIDWTATNCDSSAHSVYYGEVEEDCEELDSEDWTYIEDTHAITELLWDINSIDDGKYCVKVENLGCCEDKTAGAFCIDNTEPELDIYVEGCSSEGVESDDENNPDTQTTIEIEYSDESCDMECEVSCLIDWGDGSEPVSCHEGENSYQYADNGEYDVEVVVEDCAGNTVTESEEVEVENVVPTLDGIIASGSSGTTSENNIFVTGEVIEFSAINPWDVDADFETLEYYWNFDCDGVQSGTEENPTFVYTETGECSVSLYLKDKDGGESETFEIEIELVGTEEMTPTQSAVVNKWFRFDLDEPWADGSYYHWTFFNADVPDMNECEGIVIPTGMSVGKDGEGKCWVSWVPSEEQRGGPHLAIIKVSNEAGEYKYYSFNTMVYSWEIELQEGWNLISIPLASEDTSIDSVFEGIIDKVAYEGTSTATVLQYDAVDNKWYKARRYSTSSGFTWSSSNELEDIVPGYGYWIKMEEPTTLYGIGEDFMVDTVPGANGIELATESWNLIGRFGIEPTSLDWAVALESLRPPFYSQEYVNPTLGIYKLDSVTASGVTSWSDAPYLTMAKGYWIRTAADDNRETIIYEPNSI